MAVYRINDRNPVYICFLIIKTTGGLTIIGGISSGFGYIIAKAMEGINFVFAGIANIDPKTDKPVSVYFLTY